MAVVQTSQCAQSEKIWKDHSADRVLVVMVV